MFLIWAGTGIGVLATLLIWLLLCLVRWRRPRLRTSLWILALATPGHALVTVPAVLAWLGANLIGTRGDERAYRGPLFDAEGTWLPQTRASLAANPPTGPAAPAAALDLRAEDGVTLRAYHVPAAAPARGVSAVLVHGLFRGALELETVGRWLRELGCDVLLLELRNHGQSGRGRATFGPLEAVDVRAACAAMRSRHPGQRLVLFGVSLGTVAVSLAAPEIEGLAGLVLDAPVFDLPATADRMLGHRPAGQPRRLGLIQPFRSLTLAWLQAFLGVDFAATRPAEALAQLRPDLPALVVGGARDDRVTPDDVRHVYEALPGDANHELWLVQDADHGDAWSTDPTGYRLRLAALLDRL